ncbi:MAG TPA: sigma 54-interacting transcriptional regulator [Candidatus Polarisedimenticolaceae bacterium]
MRVTREHSPHDNGASIEALRWLLAIAAGAVGAERAFLVRRPTEGSRSDPEVLAAFPWAAGADPAPSRTLLWRAVASSGVLSIDDASRDARLADSPSVRALEIRSAVCVPLPRRFGDGAVVLDSRATLPPSREERTLVEACAAIAGFVLRTGPTPQAVPRPPAHRAPAPIRFEARSSASATALDAARRLGATELPVLILGESGTGKELLAREVHDASRRARGPFIAVNGAALPDSLVESELFGAVKGAFTGADRDRPGLVRAARGGTLFLDEIGDLPLPAQAKLLRVLQESSVRPVGATTEVHVDVRVVAATHRDLRRRVAEGRFREDLFHRIAFGVVEVPPLRLRLEELRHLAPLLVERLAARYGLLARPLAACAMRRLLAHDWPGNVRELEAVLARALVAAPDGTITAGDLELAAPAPAIATPGEGLEAAMIHRALAESGGAVASAARRIGWTRQKLYRAMRRLRLERVRTAVSPIPGDAPGGGRR